MTLLEHMIESHPILENSFRMDSFIEVLKKNNKRTNLLKAFVLSYLSLSSNYCVCFRCCIQTISIGLQFIVNYSNLMVFLLMYFLFMCSKKGLNITGH
jgi:hypothetical protein